MQDDTAAAHNRVHQTKYYLWCYSLHSSSVLLAATQSSCSHEKIIYTWLITLLIFLLKHYFLSPASVFFLLCLWMCYHFLLSRDYTIYHHHVTSPLRSAISVSTVVLVYWSHSFIKKRTGWTNQHIERVWPMYWPFYSGVPNDREDKSSELCRY